MEKRDPEFNVIVRDNVIAEGEATGHQHKLQDGVVYKSENNRQILAYVEAKEPTQINHNEHKPLPIESGTYQVRQQREFNGEENNNVSD